MNKSQWSSHFRLRNRIYGCGNPTYIIAEIGSNHGGNWERARKLVEACAKTGANAVKFQSWQPKGIQNIKDITPDGDLIDSKAIPILEKYMLPEEWHGQLVGLCHDLNIDFLSTPFDIERARLLYSLKVPAIKIASGDLTYEELLREVGKYGLPVFLSTGMSNLGEIQKALEFLGTDNQRDIILLHCVGAYPPNLHDANLLAIRTLREVFDVPVGISDHYPGHDIVLAAIALGASVVEKHVTFFRADDTPDSFFALEMDEFKDMVEAIRDLEIAMGDGQKHCMPSEKSGKVGGRRCLFAARDLKVGEILSREDIAVVRPNIGDFQPDELNKIIGCRLRFPVRNGEYLCWKHLEIL